MEEDMGASAEPTGLSSQATEPQASPPSRASIPCAGHWLSKVPGTDIYAVVGAGGRDIGYVRKIFRTIEKDIPGKMYVAWRRTAKTPSWRWWLKGEYEPGGRYAMSADTRRAAVERLLRDAERRDSDTRPKDGDKGTLGSTREQRGPLAASPKSRPITPPYR